MIPHFVGTTILFLGLVGIGVFAVRYGWKSNWRSTAVGQGLMLMVVSGLVIGVGLLVRILFPGWPGNEWIRIVTYSFFCAASWKMVYHLILIQREQR